MRVEVDASVLFLKDADQILSIVEIADIRLTYIFEPQCGKLRNLLSLKNIS